MLVVDEDMRRLKETMALSQQTLPPTMFGKRTLVVNTNSQLIQSLYRMKEKEPELTKEARSARV